MNKVININFQGRVVPIEEPAYEELKKYIDSLRAYFAKEEGKEEIINDIENRIAELFSEKLKAGQSFISEAHVAAIIASMGRPEQFDEMHKLKVHLLVRKKHISNINMIPHQEVHCSEMKMIKCWVVYVVELVRI